MHRLALVRFCIIVLKLLNLARPSTTSACAVLSLMLLFAHAALATDQPGNTQPEQPTEGEIAPFCSESQVALDAFAGLVMRELRQMKPDADLRYDAATNRLTSRSKENGDHYFHLGSARADYCKADAAERSWTLQKYLSGFFDSYKVTDGPVSHSALLPVARGRSYFTLTELQSLLDGAIPSPDSSVQFLGSDIAVRIAADSEMSLSYLTAEDIADTELTMAQAFDKALDNLRKRSPKNWLEIRPGLYRSIWRDDCDASRLLLVDLFSDLSLKGEPVAMAPDRNTLFVTGADDIPNLLEMAKRTKELLAEATKPLSGQAIVLRGKDWVDFIPEIAALNPVADVQREQLNLDYADQKAMLERYLGDDVYVAQYDLVKNADLGGLRSFATWSEGIQTLLPRTDLVGLVTADGEVMLLIPWAAVQEVAGGHMVQTEWYPPRFEVNSFPTADELAKLKRHDLMGN